jgi:hypothetical protein
MGRKGSAQGGHTAGGKRAFGGGASYRLEGLLGPRVEDYVKAHGDVDTDELVEYLRCVGGQQPASFAACMGAALTPFARAAGAPSASTSASKLTRCARRVRLRQRGAPLCLMQRLRRLSLCSPWSASWSRCSAAPRAGGRSLATPAGWRRWRRDTCRHAPRAQTTRSTRRTRTATRKFRRTLRAAPAAGARSARGVARPRGMR